MKALLAIALLGTLALAGCSGSSGEATVPAQDAEGNYVIHMTASNKFSPMVAKVPVGATVKWVNDGGVHDVTADDGSWGSDDDLGRKTQPGDSYTHTFTVAGEVDYHCELHRSAGMKATIVVE